MSKPTIYIAVRGGVVQGVRIEGEPEADCIVVDYDELDHGDNPQCEEDFERDLIGESWAELEQHSIGIF